MKQKFTPSLCRYLEKKGFEITIWNVSNNSIQLKITIMDIPDQNSSSKYLKEMIELSRNVK